LNIQAVITSKTRNEYQSGQKTFMKIMNISSLTLLLSLFALNAVHAEPVNYHLAYVGDANNPAWQGVSQGLEEANRQGQFMNQKYTLDAVSSEDAVSKDFSGYIAVISAADNNAYRQLVEKLPDMAIFNVSLDDDDLRASCYPNALHVLPSKQMIKDAEAQWQKKDPDSKAKAQAWHPDFVKYAARDLNKRFLEARSVKMDDAAWAGWASVKIVTDTVVRQGITDPAKLLNFIKSDLVFDGQKGTDMNFRNTGQLRQILLLVENDKILDEAPVRGVVKPTDLDSLGNVECAK
jgi:hypothetical protein